MKYLNMRFNIGDKVICIQPISKVDSLFNLHENETYTISKVKDGTISLAELSEQGMSYDIERFVLDIKSQRKQKIESLCLK